MKKNQKIIAVVVTHNRKSDLKRCLDSLLSQSHPPHFVIVVDNASSDGTGEMVCREFSTQSRIIYRHLGRNLGGAGGFHFGSKFALERGADWVWLMDDDCLLQKNCLNNLVAGLVSKRDIYSPIVLSLEDRKTVLWGIHAEVNSGNQAVITLPFNGFLCK